MFLRSARLLHTTRSLCQVEVDHALATVSQSAPRLGSGKKKPPKKQNLVILSASDSKLLRRKKRNEKSDTTPKGLSIEERRQIREASIMLNFVPSVDSPTEAIEAIEALRPEVTSISKARHVQITGDLKKMFTLDQLKKYMVKQNAKHIPPKMNTKEKAITEIVVNIWKCVITSNSLSPEELIITRSFDMTKKEAFLLLSQNSIIKKWIRANVKIFIFPESRQMLVRAPEKHIQYIELALAQLFKNIQTEEVDLGNVTQLFMHARENFPIKDIQKLTGVYFEPKVAHEDEEVPPNVYIMSTLGAKKFDQAKRLILWSLDYNPFTKVSMHVDMKDEAFKMFGHFPDSSLPWIHRSKKWMRLKEPRSVLGLSKPVNLNSAQIYNDLYREHEASTDAQSVTAVTFGQLLFDESQLTSENPKLIMNTDIPFAHERIHKLPLLSTEEEDASFDNDTTDPHRYHAQIRFNPSPFNKANNYMTCPPIEFWFDIDQHDKVKVDTCQVVLITTEATSSISLPSQQTDVKFVRSDTKHLVEEFNNDQDWLADQPGIKQFLTNAVLDFSGSSAMKVPQFCDIVIPGKEEPVRYDYVYMTHRKSVDLEFKNRMLSYSVLEGGALGGRTSEVIMIGGEEKMAKEEFDEFVKDTAEFIESLQ